jgi:hypothetical protein
MDSEDPVAPSLLAPIAEDSVWYARFAAAADALFPALQSGEESRWQPLLGGQWLSDADHRLVQSRLDEKCGSLATVLGSRGPVERRILGWRAPASYTDADKAAIAARPEAEALVCWSAQPAGTWPRTVAEASYGTDRSFACTRIAYSVRGDAPRWRAFFE